MNFRYLSKKSERGIALVITLVMLAIVTVMAIVFLAVSRRERAAVKMAEDSATANAMQEVALERAKAETIARMAIGGSKLHYDLFNSTNFAREFYTPQAPNTLPNPSNVSYNDKDGNTLTGQDYMRMLANLQYDPRPPVFYETNQNGNGDMRFYLDFNRNRLFETNGLVREIDNAGAIIGTNRLVGDPEWIGVLERPDYPHSESNRFIGRMAYLVLPAGKTLDLNFIHNQADRNSDDIIDRLSARNGFNRNQGVGSWEINLAAFLRELNTNTYAWGPASYRFRLSQGQLPSGFSFDDARAILAFRYNGNRRSLARADFTFGLGNPFNPSNRENFRGDSGVDDYTDDDPPTLPGDKVFTHSVVPVDNDDPARPWPGSLNTNAFTDLQQLFSLAQYSQAFTNRLQRSAAASKSTYDRYSFYRLASQLGVDSTPALHGKLHLNYDNEVGRVTNTFRRWTNAVRFFTNAAQLMLKASVDRVFTNNVNGTPTLFYVIGDTVVRGDFSITNIQIATNFVAGQSVVLSGNQSVYNRGNEYTPTIHRILQLAVNIYDNMENRGTQYPYYPTAIRPIYQRTATNLIISGWLEETNASRLQLVWQGPVEFTRTNTTPSVRPETNYNFYGQHVIIGAKKGHPNLNELALESYVEVSRKLEISKNLPGGTINATNQMFLVSLRNRWGIEGWNSYTSTYPRNVRILGEVVSKVSIRDENGATPATPPVFTTINRPNANFPTNNWAATANHVIMDRNYPLLSDVAYSRTTGFRATNLVTFFPLEEAPRFQIITTNNVRFWMYDSSNNRIIDFVSFDNLVTVTDLTTNLYAAPSQGNQTFGNTNFNDAMLWDPTPVTPGSKVTVGMTNQIAISSGDIYVPSNTWSNYRFNSADRDAGIASFRLFMGLGLRPTDPQNIQYTSDQRRQTPFVPTRRMHQIITWQANDPMVHYMAEDLRRIPGSDKPENVEVGSPLKRWNIGEFNTKIYRPWGEPSETDVTAYRMAIKDPGIRKSDDWDFPAQDGKTNFFPNIGALGRVHRGTPWQTVYLKPIMQFATLPDGSLTNRVEVDPNAWKGWSGSAGTYPMNDWKLLDVFTTAPNENAARGLLSVNQTNRAAWSAVLSGAIVATNIVKTRDLMGLAYNEGLAPSNSYEAEIITPATPQIVRMVDSINLARNFQVEVVRNPYRTVPQQPEWLLVRKTNFNNMQPLTVFQHMGDVLGASHLTMQSPFLNNHSNQVHHVWTDRAVEYVPSQVLSLLQRDEPRFVVYAFGQALKPAPHSLVTSANFYNLCTNYQITGEVITKTTFRVEGELKNPAEPMRTVVESYNILPPPE